MAKADERMSGKPAYILTVQPTGKHPAPFEVRMRQWLKLGLRAFRAGSGE